jgi:uncharacterized protein (DUF2235 family)
MAKRIVACSDGTGNTAIKGRGTNVFKLFEAVDLNGHRFDAVLTPQIAFYDDGVGTEAFKPLKIFAGVTGFGLSRNVRRLYKELARVYDPGDEIYMFGFSRGAFTVRTLVGFIAACGVINPQKLDRRTSDGLEDTVRKAYKAYRKCYRTQLAKLFLGEPKTIAEGAGEAFRRQHSYDEEVRVRFLGVWDTVDAVGLPFHLGDVVNTVFYRFKFPDRKLSVIVDRARHALAIDEARQSFGPLLWDEKAEEKKGRVEQVWFAGSHSNVGGGYPKQGMSLVALDWMLAEAGRRDRSTRGLRLNADERRSYEEHANVDDKLYDSRAGLGIFYRWKIRDMEKMCGKYGVRPKLHISVLERVAHGPEDYSPGNLPTGAQVVITNPDRPEHAALALQRAANVQKVLSETEDRLLGRLKRELVVGQLSYYIYLASDIAVLVVASGWNGGRNAGEIWSAIVAVGRLIGGLLSSPIDTAIASGTHLTEDPQRLVWLAAGFLTAYFMQLYADRRMSGVFSEYWYKQQPKLREALKLARKEIITQR